VLLHTRGPAREGWLSMVAVDTEGLLLTSATESAHLAASASGSSSNEGL
jgi:hypothetical protein